jgi:hypothetical protein
MIVIAVLNTDRNRDLTPSRDTTEVRMGRGADNHSGGGERFLSFLSDDLIPHIDSLYPTTPYRVFIGHSLGGLMVMQALVNHNRLFNGYIAIDPSMWWDRGRLLHQVQAAAASTTAATTTMARMTTTAMMTTTTTTATTATTARTATTATPATAVTRDYGGASLFLAGANSLQNGLDTVSVMSDTSSIFSRHMQSIFLTRNSLAATRGTGTAAGSHLYFGWKYYPEYNHNSVPLVAEYDGLRFLFNFYRLDFPHDVFEEPSFKGDTLLAAHYAAISRRMGYTVFPPEMFINNIGYSLLGRRQFDRAFYYFHLNVVNYPNSFNVYDSMGDLYLARGEKALAMESWTKALTLRDYPETRQKLEKLQKEK